MSRASATLSGGEGQRIPLATQIGASLMGVLYILDEPSIGLHFDDISKLLSVLHLFADAGNTVIIIEHNLDVIKSADHIIDLGPEGGDAGGEVVACGTPEEVAENPRSFTGQFLRRVLHLSRRRELISVPSPAPVSRPPPRRGSPSSGYLRCRIPDRHEISVDFVDEIEFFHPGVHPHVKTLFESGCQ